MHVVLKGTPWNLNFPGRSNNVKHFSENVRWSLKCLVILIKCQSQWFGVLNVFPKLARILIFPPAAWTLLPTVCTMDAFETLLYKYKQALIWTKFSVHKFDGQHFCQLCMSSVKLYDFNWKILKTDVKDKVTYKRLLVVN